MSRVSGVVIFGLACVFAGCGGGSTCAPGESRDCVCTAGGSGTQECTDGKAFGACSCAHLDGGASDGGTRPQCVVDENGPVLTANLPCDQCVQASCSQQCEGFLAQHAAALAYGQCMSICAAPGAACTANCVACGCNATFTCAGPPTCTGNCQLTTADCNACNGDCNVAQAQCTHNHPEATQCATTYAAGLAACTPLLECERASCASACGVSP